jgi:nucleoside-diphosphate-sugar epimerase
LRTIVLRAGDYFGGEGRGSWFDRIVVKGIAAGRLTYPGPLDVIHEWAYLPDVAQAMVQLAERREQLAPFATLGFAGHALTGREFVAAISRACRRDFQIDFVPWRLLKMMGVVVPVFRELADISYLWSTPHAIDGARLAEIIGDFPRTLLDPAIAASLAALGLKRRANERS